MMNFWYTELTRRSLNWESLFWIESGKVNTTKEDT